MRIQFEIEVREKKETNLFNLIAMRSSTIHDRGMLCHDSRTPGYFCSRKNIEMKFIDFFFFISLSISSYFALRVALHTL